MHLITLDEAFERFKKWYLGLSVELKEKILKFCFINRPRPHVNIATLLGFENTGKAFDLNLGQGQIAESELAEILAGKIEVKTDAMVSKTGNVAIEYWCRGKPSGVTVTESEWWATILSGDKYQGEVIVLVRTKRLLEMLKGARSVKGGDNGVARMHLLPVERLVK